jgi:hypothetical protein
MGTIMQELEFCAGRKKKVGGLGKARTWDFMAVKIAEQKKGWVDRGEARERGGWEADGLRERGHPNFEPSIIMLSLFLN